MRSIPAITHLSYFDVIFALFRRGGEQHVDDARVAIGQAVEEWALRGEARRTRDWRSPLAYRDTTVDCLRELMRWNLVDPTTLADDSESFERIRTAPLRLTAEGQRVAGLTASERREEIGQLLLYDYAMFRDFLAALEAYDVVVPEHNDARLRSYFPDQSRVADDQDGWHRLAKGCQEALGASTNIAPTLRAAPRPTLNQLAEDVGRYLRRRFLKRPVRRKNSIRAHAARSAAVGAVGASDANPYRW